VTSKTAAEFRAKAAELTAERAAIWERSDTDGFVSAWAAGLGAEKAMMEAELAERGGTSDFIALFTTEGEWVPAKVIDGKWGRSWMVLDSTGKRTGEYLPYHPARRSTLAKKGYVEGYATWPAYIGYSGGTGTGLSGACSVRPRRLRRGYDHTPPVAIVTTDRWAEEA
jgi:hypothetical protein